MMAFLDYKITHFIFDFAVLSIHPTKGSSPLKKTVKKGDMPGKGHSGGD